MQERRTAPGRAFRPWVDKAISRQNASTHKGDGRRGSVPSLIARDHIDVRCTGHTNGPYDDERVTTSGRQDTSGVVHDTRLATDGTLEED